MPPESVAPVPLEESLVITMNQVISNLVSLLPRLLLALLALMIGVLLGKLVKSIILKLLKAINFSSVVKDSPLERYSPKSDVVAKIEDVIGEIFRWSVIFIFLIGAFNLLGLTTVAQVLVRIVNYIPQIISACIILVLGILAAGLVESVVKNALGSIDPATGRLMGKVSSYTVVVLATLAAISELGIAKFFINVLFIGFVTMLTLGIGLAFGLGAKDTINAMMSGWYKREFEKRRPKDEKTG